MALLGTVAETVGATSSVLGATDKHLEAFLNNSCSVLRSDPSIAAVFATTDLRILEEKPLLLSTLKLLESGS